MFTQMKANDNWLCGGQACWTSGKGESRGRGGLQAVRMWAMRQVQELEDNLGHKAEVQGEGGESSALKSPWAITLLS